MKESTTKLLVLAALVIAVISFAQSAYLLVRPRPVTSPAGSSEPDSSALQAEVRRLQDQVASMTDTLASLSRQKPTFAPANTAASAEQDDAGAAGVALLDDAISRLEQIVDSVGLEQLATNERMNPAYMRDMYSEYAERKMAEEARQRGREISAQLMEADRAKYGDEVQTLFDQARQRGGRGRGNRGTDEERAAQDAEREKALNDLIAKYPDANMTGMLLTERAVGATFRGDTATVEKYYQQLTANRNFAGLTTEWGVQAVPSVQYMLASRYINEGRNAEAEAVISALERDYGESKIYTMGGRGGRGGRGPGGPPSLQSGSSAAAQLRQRMNAPRN